MSMSDCEKCWETPCTCGYAYRKISDYKLAELRAVIEKECLRRVILCVNKEEGEEE